MRKCTLSSAAQDDILSILTWTHKEHGESARIRYETLIAQGIIDIANSPTRAGVTERDDLAQNAYTYHLWHSRNNVDKLAERVKKTRHILLFRIIDNCVEIARALHDSMDLERHIPSEFDS